MPYKIALIDDDSDEGLFYLDTIIDFLFMFDIFINFNLAEMTTDDQIDCDRRSISLKYIKTWFVIDLFASMPMNLLSKFLIPVEVNLKG